ncbi:hypothetical protein [Desulfovibrio inopinatus]|uniref:hypothetical protein n=1 Tax=Desulfovibrio inopinatus TaxID=102109 RepID=UPI000489092D|nr:hypothetical protein [Desulfovibrio inopinatus]
MIHGETVHSPLPQDLPLWSADHFVFFSVLYLVILILGSGMGYVILKSLRETCEKDDANAH